MGRHDDLINKLWPDEADRKAARAFVAKYDGEPMIADYIEPLLREAVPTLKRVAAGEISAEKGREYLGSFATDGLGIPDHIAASGVNWLAAGGMDPGEVSDEKLAEMGPEVRQLLANQDREDAKKDVARFEEMLRDPEGSRKYWSDSKLQNQYRNALERSIAVPEAPAAAPASPADEVRAALLGTAPPAATTAAPAPTAPVAPPSPAAEPARM